MDIAGEIGVLIRAITEKFGEDAQNQVTEELKGVKAPVVIEPTMKGTQADASKAIEEMIAQETRLRTVREQAKDTQTKLTTALQAQASAMAAGGALQAAFANSFYAQELPALQTKAAEIERNIFLEEEYAAALKRRAREALKASQTPTAPEDGGAGGPSALRKVTAGRTAGLAGLLGMGARLGLVGLAAQTAFQAVSELQGALRVTGDDAFTAEGKIRNLGAELLGGNLIGGIKALTAVRKAEISGNLGDAVKADIAKERAAKDDLVITEEKLGLMRQKGRDTVVGYIATLELQGRITEKEADALLRVSDNMEKQRQIVEASTSAWANYTAAVEKAGSVTKAFGPDSGGGPRGPGGVAAQSPVTAGTPVFHAGTGGADVANQIRASINSRIQDEVLIANARVAEAKIVQKQKKAAFDVAKEVAESAGIADGAAKEWREYVEATTGVVTASQQAKLATESAAQAAQDLGNAVRDAWVSAIADPALAAQAGLKAQRIKEHQAKTAFDEAVKGTKAANEAYGKWQIEKAKTAGIEASMAETAKNAAKQAAETAASAKESALANDIAAAELTGDVGKIRAAYRAAINYWEAIKAGTKATSEAHQAAVGQIISLTAALQKVGAGGGELKQAKIANDIASAELKGLDTRPLLLAQVRYARQAMNTATQGTLAFEEARGSWIAAWQNLKSTNDTLNDLKRANAKARAALTESEEDDERLLRAEIRRLERKVKATKGMGIAHQKAIQELLGAERELKGMVDEIEPTTTVFDLLTKSTKAFTEHAGNLINERNRFTADSFTAGIRGEIGTSPNAAGRARLGIDDRGIITATDRNTTALDRLTAAIGGRSGAGGSAVGAGANLATGRDLVVGLRYQAMADRYAEIARAARGGIN